MNLKLPWNNDSLAGAGVGFVCGVLVGLFLAFLYTVGADADGTPATAVAASSPKADKAGRSRDSSARRLALRQGRPTGPRGLDRDSVDLRKHRLLFPVLGGDVAATEDSFFDARGNSRHEAVDIRAARNTPVVAVEDGRIAKLFLSKQGGNTIYQFDPSETYAYYYAHLERYADRLSEGDPVKRGQIIGYVGTSGNAPPGTPHLHFGIFKLTEEKKWWKGTPLDPYPILNQPQASH